LSDILCGSFRRWHRFWFREGGRGHMTYADFKSRIESKLSKCGLEWKESEHYLKGVLDVGSGRTQAFLVDTNVDHFGPYQDHDILSPVCRVADQSERIKAVAFALMPQTRYLRPCCERSARWRILWKKS
jgi:hypothetical protein